MSPNASPPSSPPAPSSSSLKLSPEAVARVSNSSRSRERSPYRRTEVRDGNVVRIQETRRYDHVMAPACWPSAAERPVGLYSACSRPLESPSISPTSSVDSVAQAGSSAPTTPSKPRRVVVLHRPDASVLEKMPPELVHDFFEGHDLPPTPKAPRMSHRPPPPELRKRDRKRFCL